MTFAAPDAWWRWCPNSPNNGNGEVLEWVRMLIQSPNWMFQESVHPNEFGHIAMANCVLG